MNKCKICDATSYKPIIRRDEKGVLRVTGQYQCAGCKREFATFDDWRNGDVLGEKNRLYPPEDRYGLN